MDGLSAAASVIAVIQITQQIFIICQTYYLEVKDARKDIQLLSDEVTSLKDVLTNLKDLGDSPSSAELSSLKLLNQPNGPLERCEADLRALVTKLEPGTRTGDSKMKQFGLRALKWPFSSKDVYKVITAIERNKNLFNLALSSDQMYVETLLFVDCHYSLNV
jgi:ankyrin repeat domain-containing protein 50